MKRFTLFKRKKKPEFPKFYHNNEGVYVKCLDESKYIKYYTTIDGDTGKLIQQENDLKHHSTADLFSTWTEAKENDFNAFLEAAMVKKSHWQTSKPTEFAFELNGRQFWRFVNIWDMPIGRQTEAEVLFMEFSARMDRDYIKNLMEKIRAKTKGDEIDVGGIAILANDALHRLNLIVDWNLYEKMASVLYYDDAEDLSVYDFDYNQKKIQFWRDNGGNDFFLSMPLSELLPSGKELEHGLNPSLMAAKTTKDLIEARLREL